MSSMTNPPAIIPTAPSTVSNVINTFMAFISTSGPGHIARLSYSIMFILIISYIPKRFLSTFLSDCLHAMHNLSTNVPKVMHIVMIIAPVNIPDEAK